jgi:hypothetical protein
MDRPTSRSPLPTSILLTSLLLLLAACGGATPAGSTGAEPGGEPSAPASQGGGDDGGDAEATPGTSLTSCEIVTAADIEAALDLDPGTVSEGTFEEQPNVLDEWTNECRYEDDTWGGLVVHVTPADGQNVWDALVSTYGDEAEDLGMTDGGLWFADDNRGYFIKGSVEFFLQFTHLIDVSDFREPTVELGQAGLDKL